MKFFVETQNFALALYNIWCALFDVGLLCTILTKSKYDVSKFGACKCFRPFPQTLSYTAADILFRFLPKG